MVENIIRNVDGASEYLGISPSTIRNGVKSKVIPHHRIGDRIIFTQRDLEEFLEQCAIPSHKGVKD